MKKGFTIVEVSILFVIFIIVAFLVAPLSVDDTVQARNTSKWRVVQQEFTNIYSSIIPRNVKLAEAPSHGKPIVASVFEKASTKPIEPS